MIKFKIVSIIIAVVLIALFCTGVMQASYAQTLNSVNDIQLENSDDNFAYGLFGKGWAVVVPVLIVVFLSICVICTTGLIRKK